MTGYIVQCDNSNCKKLDNLTETYGQLPKGWITLSGGENINNQNKDKHFCSIECLQAHLELMEETV